MTDENRGSFCVKCAVMMEFDALKREWTCPTCGFCKRDR